MEQGWLAVRQDARRVCAGGDQDQDSLLVRARAREGSRVSEAHLHRMLNTYLAQPVGGSCIIRLSAPVLPALWRYTLGCQGHVQTVNTLHYPCHAHGAWPVNDPRGDVCVCVSWRGMIFRKPRALSDDFCPLQHKLLKA